MSTALATLAGKLAERVGMDSVDPQELITTLRQPERDITPVNDETMQEINTLLIALDKTWDDDLLPLCSQIFRRDIRASSELTQAEAVKVLGFLKQKASEQKVAA
ncbi:recombinase [Escherichia coli]|nr:recombinase [Escherichia coli]